MLVATGDGSTLLINIPGDQFPQVFISQLNRATHLFCESCSILYLQSCFGNDTFHPQIISIFIVQKISQSNMYIIIKYFSILVSANSGSRDSPTAFDWLAGYGGCRTGWDRFSKPLPHPPHSSNPFFSSGDTSTGPLEDAFPEKWPWSHIITPNTDGSTDVAS